MESFCFEYNFLCSCCYQRETGIRIVPYEAKSIKSHTVNNDRNIDFFLSIFITEWNYLRNEQKKTLTFHPTPKKKKCLWLLSIKEMLELQLDVIKFDCRNRAVECFERHSFCDKYAWNMKRIQWAFLSTRCLVGFRIYGMHCYRQPDICTIYILFRERTNIQPKKKIYKINFLLNTNVQNISSEWTNSKSRKSLRHTATNVFVQCNLLRFKVYIEYTFVWFLSDWHYEVS